MHEAVDHRGGDDFVAEDLAPPPEGRCEVRKSLQDPGRFTVRELAFEVTTRLVLRRARAAHPGSPKVCLNQRIPLMKIAKTARNRRSEPCSGARPAGFELRPWD